MLHAAAGTDRRSVPFETAAAFILALRSRGLRDTAVLGAMERVEREMFAPRRFADLARSDVALPLPCGQTMTAPSIVAAMLVALGVEPGQRALEIGTGSGYTAALLARLGAQVVTVERFATLAEEARGRLAGAGLARSVLVAAADGLRPAPGEGRVERILINGTLSHAVPAAVTSLLAPGGRLVGALTVEGLPRLLRVDRGLDGALVQELGPPLRLDALWPGRAAAL